MQQLTTHSYNLASAMLILSYQLREDRSMTMNQQSRKKWKRRKCHDLVILRIRINNAAAADDNNDVDDVDDRPNLLLLHGHKFFHVV